MMIDVEIRERVLLPIEQIMEIPSWAIGMLMGLKLLESLFIWLMKESANRVILPDGGSEFASFLIGNALFLFIMMLLLAMLCGRMAFWELGIKDNRLVTAVRMLLWVWGMIQVFNIIAGTFMSEYGNEIIKGLLVQKPSGTYFSFLFVRALPAGIFFRGFLLVQMIKKFGRTRKAYIGGILLSQALWALFNTLLSVSEGLTLEMSAVILSALMVYLLGISLSILYLATDNLFITFGFHALLMNPSMMYDGPMTYPLLILSIVLLPFLWRKVVETEQPLPLIPLTTERLRLRPWRMGDAQDLYDYAKSELVGPSAGWKPHSSLSTSKEVIQHFIRAGDVYAIELLSTGKVIGGIGIHDKKPDSSDDRTRQREIGYVLNPDYWGKGYMPEAVTAVKSYCFDLLGLEIIWCGHFIDNDQSKRVIEKCGFTYSLTKETVLPSMGHKRIMTKYYSIDRRHYEKSKTACDEEEPFF